MTVDIGDSDTLRRHVNPQYLHEDGTVSTGAFKTTDMSLDLCRLRARPESFAAAKPGSWMGEFGTPAVRDSGLEVVHDPIIGEENEPDNPSHCKIPGKTTNSQAKRLRDASTFHRP